jgi:hypothetical protein
VYAAASPPHTPQKQFSERALLAFSALNSGSSQNRVWKTAEI